MPLWIKKLKLFFLKLSIPFQKWIQRRGRKESGVTYQDYLKVKELAEPGDILVAFETGRLTAHFIKGKYKHAAMIPDNVDLVIDAVGDFFVNGHNHGGVRSNQLQWWLFQQQGFALIRPNLPKYLRYNASKNAPTYVGTGYGYTFEYGPEDIYCSELPYLCYRPVDTNFMSDTGDEILPQEYRDRCDKAPFDFILVYESKG